MNDKHSIEFRINEITPSLNVVYGRRWAGSNWKKKFQRLLRNYELLPCEQTWLQEKKKRRLYIDRHSPKLLDQDNFYGGLKCLIDVIKGKGLIVDDSLEWIVLITQQVKDKQKYMIVRIEEILEDKCAG